MAPPSPRDRLGLSVPTQPKSSAGRTQPVLRLTPARSWKDGSSSSSASGVPGGARATRQGLSAEALRGMSLWTRQGAGAEGRVGVWIPAPGALPRPPQALSPRLLCCAHLVPCGHLESLLCGHRSGCPCASQVPRPLGGCLWSSFLSQKRGGGVGGRGTLLPHLRGVCGAPRPGQQAQRLSTEPPGNSRARREP